MKNKQGQSKIGSRLRALRTQKRLSAKDIAQDLGIAESTYRDWEYGRAINGEPYLALAKIFGVSLSELLPAEITDERRFLLDRLSKLEELLSEIRSAL